MSKNDKQKNANKAKADNKFQKDDNSKLNSENKNQKTENLKTENKKSEFEKDKNMENNKKNIVNKKEKNIKPENAKVVENKSEKENKKALIKTKQEKKEKSKFAEKFKKRWLINGTKTFILVLIIIAVFVGITVWMKKLDITPIDLTEDKLYTLTDESKEQIKNIDKDVNVYFVGYDDDSSQLDLAKQYSKVNDKIHVEAVTAESRPDLAQKYGIDSTTSTGIIVECGEKYKVLSSNDLTTYDTSTNESIDVSEEKITAAIRSVVSEEIPKVYFLSGYTAKLSLDKGMSYLSMYLQNEINEVDTLDILTTGKVPDDCNVLVVTTPDSDFDETTANAILDYINKGGNILWLNGVKIDATEFPNVNKVLAAYGVKPFEVGLVREAESSKMVYNSPDFILPTVQSADVTNKISAGVIFINPTKINVVSDDELSDLNVVKTELLTTSEKSYFRTDFNNSDASAKEGEEVGSFLVGAQFDKTISEKDEEAGTAAVTSKLVIYGENNFISDSYNSDGTPFIRYRENKDLVLNSIAYLANREEDIAVRKSTGAVTYTPTDKENRIVLWTITVIPLIIIFIGCLVTSKRKRQK